MKDSDLRKENTVAAYQDQRTDSHNILTSERSSCSHVPHDLVVGHSPLKIPSLPGVGVCSIHSETALKRAAPIESKETPPSYQKQKIHNWGRYVMLLEDEIGDREKKLGLG
ncbi:hypothetical protein KSP40_PGU015667 [Platanthera guangdongensis]|uniref:Uncharacterized protein n=1 Tax=Platanthera guangdongensis TaxID=2320717 RepID=A0ABR2MUW7_9ASPA